jgi:hypothetical protein
VSFVRGNRILRRRRIAVPAALAALACAVVVAHGALGLDHMGKDAGVCLAVLVVGGAIVAAGVSRLSAVEPPPLAAAVLRQPSLGEPKPVRARARDGPDRLAVFLL